MTENLKNIISKLIERYIDILEQYGEPDEAYKYLAIETFQQNWNLEAEDFYSMFRASFKKEKNLIYQNSWGFIQKTALYFPEETRKMFQNLYDETIDVKQRIKTFQKESEILLSKVQQKLNRTNIKTQQDERTISLYLAFRFPEKYILYKNNYYLNFCQELNIKPKKSGEKFLHLLELANQIIDKKILNDNDFVNTYREFYPAPDWDDKFLMLQNILYVVFREEFKETELVNLLKDFDKKDLEAYYAFLDKIIENFELQQSDKRLVFNFADKKFIVFTIGQRYILRIRNSKSSGLTFSAISSDVFTEKHYGFNGNPTAYWNSTNDISLINNHQNKVFQAIEKELNRSEISGYAKYNKQDLKKMAFDTNFRNEILSQLEYKTTEKPIKQLKTNEKSPLNQILFGAPGTGKTYNTKRIAVEIINGKRPRTRKEIISEYEDLLNGKQIVFTTFHQSLSYEDFIEGIKPETTNGTVTYEVKDGIFKSLCLNANPKNTVSFENAYKKLQAKLAEEETIELKTPTDKGFSIALNKNGNLSLMTGNKREKQGVLTKEKLLQQLNGKEVFIGWEGYFKGVINHLKAEFNFNPETSENTKNYVLIIDEINRGNVSAILGELITLLEEDKRKGNKEQMEVTLPYSNDTFSVPNNVYIIGTMNTADRSVEALDTALRRRFSFIEMPPNPNILSDSKYQDVNLKQLLETINQRIEILIDKDHQIGHSYFIGIKNLDDLKRVFRDKIIPLLEEYFYGDFGKIGLVLGGNFIFKTENTAKFPKNFAYDNDFLEDKKVYRFTPFENWNKNTFTSVYED